MCLMLPSWGLAFYYETTKLTDFKAIGVLIDDQATGGCWTNLREAKSYAEDKLQIAGANVTKNFLGKRPTADKGAAFIISVNAFRNNATCIGTVRIEISAAEFGELNPLAGVMVYAASSSVANVPSNFNTHVLEMIRVAVEELERK